MPCVIQSPERSGFPSAFLGAGADRLGLPSAIRGMPGVGYLSHCAAGAAPIINTAASVSRRANMTILLLVRRGVRWSTIRLSYPLDARVLAGPRKNHRSNGVQNVQGPGAGNH